MIYTGSAWSGIQSSQRALHDAALQKLQHDGYVYPCICTRTEIENAASAPHAGDGSSIYPGTCRTRVTTENNNIDSAERTPAWRFMMPDMRLTFRDHFAGDKTYDLTQQLGDFVVAKPDGTPAYQLAVVVDDAHADVTHVIRGDDLTDSVPRQIMLYHALGMEAKLPTYIHLPLVVGPDGRRLAKRHGDTRLNYYQQHNVPPGRMRALLARWLGIDADDNVSADTLCTQFDLAKIPRRPIVFTPADHAFLMGEHV
jgi:glutamyl-tRNA synthetase